MDVTCCTLPNPCFPSCDDWADAWLQQDTANQVQIGAKACAACGEWNLGRQIKLSGSRSLGMSNKPHASFLGNKGGGGGG